MNAEKARIYTDTAMPRCTKNGRIKKTSKRFFDVERSSNGARSMPEAVSAKIRDVSAPIRVNQLLL